MFAPIMFNFTGKKALIVGASSTGLRRAKKLSGYGCDVTILSKEFPEDSKFQLYKKIRKDFHYNDLDGYDIVVAATNNSPLNLSIVKIGRKMGLLANSVNYTKEENFQFPASFHIDDLFISVSTSGHLPFFAKKLKNRIREQCSNDLKSYLRLLKEARDLLYLDKNLTNEQRLEIFDKLQELSIPELRKYNDSIVSKDKKIIRIGTRGSNLALRQTAFILKKLEELYPDYIFLAKPIKTTGDLKTKSTISELGGKAIFTDEFNNSLKNNEIDFAVHSAKDVNLNHLDDTVVLETFPEREATNDVLISTRPIEDLEEIDKEMVIGTGSIRRKTFLENKNKNIKVKNIRGNVETRIGKLINGDYEGIILAKAGLNRLDINEEKLNKLGLYMLDLDFTPAPLQGVLAFQTKKDNEEIKEMLKSISDEKTTREANLELKIQDSFNVDCSVPFGAIVTDETDKINVKITAFPDGTQLDFQEDFSTPEEFIENIEEIKRKLGTNLE